MLSRWFRKKRNFKIIMIVTAIFVIPGFIIWGVSISGEDKKYLAAKVNKQPIYLNEFYSIFDIFQSQGGPPGITQGSLYKYHFCLFIYLLCYFIVVNFSCCSKLYLFVYHSHLAEASGRAFIGCSDNVLQSIIRLSRNRDKLVTRP